MSDELIINSVAELFLDPIKQGVQNMIHKFIMTAFLAFSVAQAPHLIAGSCCDCECCEEGCECDHCEHD